jgi:hypothetical protein
MHLIRLRFGIERIGFARRLLATTDRAFSFVTTGGPIANVVRTRIAPLLITKVTEFETAREFIFRTVSQISLNYRGGPLSVGLAGHVSAAIACRGYRLRAETITHLSPP